MIVLGFDTATAATAVGLRLADGQTLQLRDDPPPGGHPGHATRLLPLARTLLVQAGVRWREIDRIGVGVGPGGFTGLRVGIATARGLAQSLERELVGVSTLRALAEAAFNPGLRADGSTVDGAGPEANALAVVDARRGEVFAAAYERSAEGSAIALTPPRPLAPDGLDGLWSRAEERAGAGLEGALAVGDGALRYRERLAEIGASVPAVGSPLHLVSAAAICALALREAPAGRQRQVLPDYRRRPDAELALGAAAGGARG